MRHLESIASKYEIADGAPFRSLRDLMYRFSADRTALANGVNGKRFYVLNDPIALARNDETHLFEVLVDGERLRLEPGDFLAALQKESSSGDEYADTYSPNWPNRKEAIQRVTKTRVEKNHDCRVLGNRSYSRRLSDLAARLSVQSMLDVFIGMTSPNASNEEKVCPFAMKP